MIYATLNPVNGVLSDIRHGVQQYDNDVVLVSWPTGPGPFAYDPVNQVAIPWLPPLADAIAAVVTALSQQSEQFIQSHYSPSVLAMFNGLFVQSIAQGLTNRATYCSQLLTWGASVSQSFAEAVAQVQAMTDVPTVQAFVWDTSSLASADPGITLAGAMAITN